MNFIRLLMCLASLLIACNISCASEPLSTYEYPSSDSDTDADTDDESGNSPHVLDLSAFCANQENEAAMDSQPCAIASASPADIVPARRDESNDLSTERSIHNMHMASRRSHAILSNISHTFYLFSECLGEMLSPYHTGKTENGLLHKIDLCTDDLAAANNIVKKPHIKKLAEIQTAINTIANLVGISETQDNSNKILSAMNQITEYRDQISVLDLSIQENIKILERLKSKGTRYCRSGDRLDNKDLNLAREIIKFLTLIQLELRKNQQTINTVQSEFLAFKQKFRKTWLRIEEINSLLNRKMDHQTEKTKLSSRPKATVRKTWARHMALGISHYVSNAFTTSSIRDATTEDLSLELFALRQELNNSLCTFKFLEKQLQQAENQHTAIQEDINKLFAILDINADSNGDDINISYFDQTEARFVGALFGGEIKSQIIHHLLPLLQDIHLLDQDGTLLKFLNILSYAPSTESFSLTTDSPIAIPLPKYVRSKLAASGKALATDLSHPIPDIIRKMCADKEDFAHTHSITQPTQTVQEQPLLPKLTAIIDGLCPQLGAALIQDIKAQHGEFDDLLEHPGSMDDSFTNKVMQTEDRACILYDILCRTRLRLGRAAPMVRQLTSYPLIKNGFDKFIKKCADPIIKQGDVYLRISKWVPLPVLVKLFRLGELFIKKSNPELLRNEPRAASSLQQTSSSNTSAHISWLRRSLNGAMQIATDGALQTGHIIATTARIATAPIVHQARIAQFLQTAGTSTNNKWNAALDLFYRKFFSREQAQNWRHPQDPTQRLGLKFLIMRTFYNIFSKCGARPLFTTLEEKLVAQKPLSDDIEYYIGRIKHYRLYYHVEPLTAFMAENHRWIRETAAEFENPDKVDPIDRKAALPDPLVDSTTERPLKSEAIKDTEFRRILASWKTGYTFLGQRRR